MPKYFSAETINNLPVESNFNLITLKSLSKTIEPKPGQFYMLQAGDSLDPLLKRPLSIFDFKDGELYFLFKKRGKGTNYLSRMRKGEIIDLIGPLGNGWPQPEREFIAIAGGIGIASLMFLLKKYKDKGLLFYGAKNSTELLMLEEISKLVKAYFLSTDDGSSGDKCLVSELFLRILESNQFDKNLPIYCCGSIPMLKTFSRIIKQHDLTCYVSVEEYMACGVGACLGCVIRVANDAEGGFSYKTVCKDGPIFNLREILWDQDL